MAAGVGGSISNLKSLRVLAKGIKVKELISFRLGVLKKEMVMESDKKGRVSKREKES